MNYFYDLHIHTALSPCADSEMTPNNIVNMAILKQLDIIAITDHNSCENAKAVIDAANGKDITVIAGMEIESSEEIHMICLFPDLNQALNMQNIVYDNLPKLENRENIFGQQLIYDSEDRVIAHQNRMLLTATYISIEDIVEYTYRFNGVTYPAHIDRNSYSIISNLGMIPEQLNINAVEYSNFELFQNLIQSHNYLKRYLTINSSDAHYLEDIMERTNTIDLKYRNSQNLIDRIKQK